VGHLRGRSGLALPHVTPTGGRGMSAATSSVARTNDSDHLLKRTPVIRRDTMTERSHDEHRPPIGEDPSIVGQEAPTKLGQFYPLDDILAVVEDRSTGERAVQALKDAGVSETDLDLLDGAWFAEAMRASGRRYGVARRIAALLPTDESLLVKRYVTEAEQGHLIVVVHAERPDDVERARSVLAAHGAREMRHYRQHVIQAL
jgi:hypothetical protein